VSISQEQSIIAVVQGDTRFPLELQLMEYRCSKDCEIDAPIDLHGVDIVTLYIFQRGNETAHVDCTISGDPKNGTVVNDFWGSIWTKPGNYIGEVEVLYADGGSKRMENLLQFRVRANGRS
jgi:hypothetical protein